MIFRYDAKLFYRVIFIINFKRRVYIKLALFPKLGVFNPF